MFLFNDFGDACCHVMDGKATFSIKKSKVAPCVDPEEEQVTIEGALELSESGRLAIPFMYALAILSFRDARPRGLSEMHYEENEVLSVGDFLNSLEYKLDKLVWWGDYISGRRLKTSIEMRCGGKFKLETYHRGQAALRWIDKLQGKPALTVHHTVEAH